MKVLQGREGLGPQRVVVVGRILMQDEGERGQIRKKKGKKDENMRE